MSDSLDNSKVRPEPGADKTNAAAASQAAEAAGGALKTRDVAAAEGSGPNTPTEQLAKRKVVKP